MSYAAGADASTPSPLAVKPEGSIVVMPVSLKVAHDATSQWRNRRLI